jgi:hypothetical protein
MRSRSIRRRTAGNGEGLPSTLHPVLRRIYAARRLQSAEDLDYGIGRLHAPDRLDGAEPAAPAQRAPAARHLADRRDRPCLHQTCGA